MNYTYNPDEAEWEAVLLGHRIVSVEQYNDESATLTLEDGTKFRVRGNEGCGGCSNGYYYVSHIATVDNVITAVRCDTEPVIPDADHWYEEAYTYRVFVLTGNQEVNVLTVEGDDGNGYYGTGYYLEILED